MPYPGSLDALTLKVDPYDNTTLATLTLQAPDGTSSTPSTSSSDGGHTWVANPTYAQVGKHVAKWTITGVGAGVTAEEVWVSQIPTGAAAVAWRPEAWHVAAYVPRRTLVGAVDGYGNPLNTFSSSTHPPLDQVALLITDACAWVQLRTGPVDASLTNAASAVAAVAAAAAIEGGYPDNRDDLSNAQLLQQRADAMRDDLWRANEAITGTDPEDPTAHLMPVYAFPRPVAWGDQDFF